MIEVYLKPPGRQAWQYDGSNWATIAEEMAGVGLVLDVTVHADSVTYHSFVLGVPTDYEMYPTDWMLRTGADTVLVMTDSDMWAAYYDAPPAP